MDHVQKVTGKFNKNLNSLYFNADWTDASSFNKCQFSITNNKIQF